VRVSVSGEFRRILGDAVECLREQPAEGADELAARLEAAARGEDLSGAAERVLGLVGTGRLAGVGARSERLDDAAERLTAICRIILGR
jgi:hypothetical protein